MSENNKCGQYSTSDIQKYLRGELSAPEMNALEKAALDDPFLADAINGMEAIEDARLTGKTSTFQEGLDELTIRLENRIADKSKKQAILLRHSTWLTAASLILLAGLGATAYFLSGNGKTVSSIARQEEKRSLPTPASSGDKADSTVMNIPDSSKTAPDQPNLAAAAPSSEREPKRSATQSPGSRKPAPATPSEPKELNASNASNGLLARRSGPSNKALTVTNNAPADLAYANNTKANKSSALAAAKEDLMKKVHSETDNKFLFSGKVIDENNLPITGASVFLAGRPDFSTVSDDKGFFRLNVAKKDSMQRLMVNYVGYESASMELEMDDLQANSSNIIRLKPQTSTLNEVVVTGFGTMKKKDLVGTGNVADSNALLPKIVAGNAAPSNGLPEYTNWLDKNWRTAAAAADSGRKGLEKVSFLVNKKGELSDFRVGQSLSPILDSVMIRLIRQGPAWRLAKGKKDRVTITAPF